MEYKERKVLKYFKNGREYSEEILDILPLTGYGWSIVELAMQSFYNCNSVPNKFKVEKYLRSRQFRLNGELILDNTDLLHFSTGFTNVDTVKDILQGGLKCFERNAARYNNNFGKAVNESNYVVDTWQINTPMYYSDFTQDAPKYAVGIDGDREDATRAYAPAHSTNMYTDQFFSDIKKGLLYGYNNMSLVLRRNIEERALQNIGFIIDASGFSDDMQKLDIYSNPTMQKEFCGDSFLRTSKMKGCYTILKRVDDKIHVVGNYGVASYVYGIPGEHIVGVVSTYGMLYSNEICKELFYNGMAERFVISPNGVLLYAPNPSFNLEQNFNVFIQNKDAFLLEQDKSYAKILEDRNSGKLNGTTWTGRSAASNRGALKLLDDLVYTSRYSNNNTKPLENGGLGEMES